MIDLSTCDAASVVRALGLLAHPEGGFYRETFRDERIGATGRAASTAIYFMLAEGQFSRWHRVDAAELWHFHAGAPLQLDMAPDASTPPVRCRLGLDLRAGEEPQIVVPALHWQQARSLGPWTLVGCTVAPGFLFSGFEMAAADFQPGRPLPVEVPHAANSPRD